MNPLLFLSLFACAKRPTAVTPSRPDAPAASILVGVFSGQTFLDSDGMAYSVPGERTMVVELIRSADW